MPAQIHERRGQEMTPKEQAAIMQANQGNPNYHYPAPDGSASPNPTPKNTATEPSPFGGKAKKL